MASEALRTALRALGIGDRDYEGADTGALFTKVNIRLAGQFNAARSPGRD
jgi:hypothetical protein